MIIRLLIEESLIPVTMHDDTVVSGLWVGPYGGYVTLTPCSLDIDHMVPLKEAHRSGGYAWSNTRKKAFANYLLHKQHLIATWFSTNRSKNDRDPSDWMPPNRSYWCRYLTDWVEIKRRWGLTMDQDEFDTVKEDLRVCDLYTKADELNGKH